MKKFSRYSLAMAFLMAGSCGGSGANNKPVPAPKTANIAADNGGEAAIFPIIFNDPQVLTKACDDTLAKAKDLADKIKSDHAAGQHENTIATMNNLLIELDSLGPMSYLMSQVHPSADLRKSAEECTQKMEAFSTALSLDADMFAAFNALDASKLSGETARFFEKIMLGYKRSGVDKSPEIREKIASLKKEEVLYGQKFHKAITDGTGKLNVAVADLEGLPEDFIKRHQPNEDGTITITTDYPDFFPVVTYARKREIREKLYRLFLERGYPENEENLKKLLQIRYDMATTLGYPTWAQYNAEDKMIGSAAAIESFVNKIAELARPKMERDLKEMLAALQAEYPEAKVVEVWDRFYYQKQLQAKNYQLDAQEVRSYFNYNDVKSGLLAIAQKLYGLTFQRDETTPVWHESVEAYRVLENGTPIAVFYLDMHPRAGKYGHAAMFEIRNGISGRVIPAGSLVCNFPEASGAEKLALMEHSDVTTFFHEFGHLMHQLVSGRHDYPNLSGVSTEWDFVEAPSQLFEEWAWDHAVLSTFAKKADGTVINKELVERMKAADEFGKGVHVGRQMFYAALSYYYYAADPAGIDLLPKFVELQKKYSPYPHVEGTHSYANFGHLDGYNSMYYTYMWSLVIAKDLLTKFDGNLLNTEVFKAYKEKILEKGGAEPAAKIVEDFLGRPFAFEAYSNWLLK